MSEPRRHDRLGALCAPTCPACREVGRQVRAEERRTSLESFHPIDLLEEVEKRIGALFTENSELRTQARTVADKTERMDRLDNARLDQIKNLEQARKNAETRVREFRERLGLLVGFVGSPPEHMVTDKLLVEKLEAEIKYLKQSIEELESAASDQDESLATTSETHRLIFDLVHRATGVRTEGLTVSEAVETVTKALKDVQRMHQEAVDRSRAYESETRELRDTAKKLRHQLDELRTAQAPRWCPVGTSPEVGVNETTRRANLKDYSIQVPEARSYVWLDRDRDPWTWSTELGRWMCFRRENGIVRALTDMIPDKIHGPYECAGLIRPVTDSPETLSNLLRGDDQRWSRSYSWIDRDGDAWVWVPFVNQWMCVGRHGEELEDQDVSLRPSSEHGPYQRGERVSG